MSLFTSEKAALTEIGKAFVCGLDVLKGLWSPQHLLPQPKMCALSPLQPVL